MIKQYIKYIKYGGLCGLSPACCFLRDQAEIQKQASLFGNEAEKPVLLWHWLP